MESEIPLKPSLVEQAVRENHMASPGRASIRELSRLVDDLEKRTGVKFLRMEMGIPGLPVCSVGTEAEVSVLRSGATCQYPNIQGLPKFKESASAFLEAFLGIPIPPECCLPCTGSTNGSFMSFMVAGRRVSRRKTILFLDPGFPVHKLQVKALGLAQASLDIYGHRGSRLEPALEGILSRGDVSALLYSNPNNPTWMCLTEQELGIIGELCSRYDVIALEDLAYFGMDLRQDFSVPNQPPFPATVARHTGNYMLLISSSKLFSYAGHRIGILAVSPSLFQTRWEDLLQFFTTDRFGDALAFGAAYAMSAGVNYSSQLGLAAILEAAVRGELPLLAAAHIYGQRASVMKRLFLESGFRLVYGLDVDEPIADGFYFTVSFPGLTGVELTETLLRYGISAISLANTGSERLEGIRACVSLIDETDFPILEKRLRLFQRDQSNESWQSQDC